MGAEYKHEILLRAIAPDPMPDQGEDIKPIYDFAFTKQREAHRETAFAVVC